MTLLLTWGVYIANRRKEYSMFAKHIKLIENRFSRSKVIQISQGAGTPGTERDIAFSQLMVKGLNLLARVARSLCE
jgi:hypothetical protein